MYDTSKKIFGILFYSIYLSCMGEFKAEFLIYTDVDSLIDLLENNDLPLDQEAFPYGTAPNIKWIHRTEIEKAYKLRMAYPSSMRKRQ